MRMPALTGDGLLHPVPEARAARARAQPEPAPRVVAAAEDLDLARRCLAGDAEAQGTFVQRHARMVFSVCRRKGLVATVAEDVTQDVLARAFRSLRTYRGEAKLSSWLFTLALRTLATHYRSAARQPVAAGHPGDPGFPNTPADDDWEARFVAGDRAARAREVIESLDEPARTILVAYYVAEMSVRDIARELELPVGTVKSHLHRGRRAVRERMGET